MPAAPAALRARDRLLHLLKTRGPQSARDLAERLGITPVAVRQHLVALEAEGLVRRGASRPGAGRPARLFELTPASAARFPDHHAELTAELLGSLRAALGQEGLDAVVRERTRAQLRAYREALPAPDRAPLRDRVEALAARRTAEGYMAACREQDDGTLLLVEDHCPICVAARACTGLCAEELALFREVLGAPVERTEHVLAGARRCAYRVGRPASDGSRAKAPATGAARARRRRPAGRSSR